MKLVVTGGAGFIGSHLVELLLGLGHEVHAVDNLSAGNLENLSFCRGNFRDRFFFRNVDILNKDALHEIFSGADQIFHLATQNVRLSLRQPSLVSEVNVRGTLNVLEAATKAGVDRFLYCSSSEVNGTAHTVPMSEEYCYQPETIYGASKLTGEYYTQVFHRSGWLKTVVARPHNNYGPRSHALGISEELIPKFTLAALAGKPLEVYGDGKQTRDFTFVTETAKFLYELMQREDCLGETFNICKGEEVSVGEIARLILKFAESESEIRHLAARKSDVLRLWGDNAKLRRVTGKVPTISIETGLQETVAWFREQNKMHPFQRESDLRHRDGGEWPFEDWIPRV